MLLSDDDELSKSTLKETTKKFENYFIFHYFCFYFFHFLFFRFLCFYCPWSFKINKFQSHLEILSFEWCKCFYIFSFVKNCKRISFQTVIMFLTDGPKIPSSQKLYILPSIFLCFEN